MFHLPDRWNIRSRRSEISCLPTTSHLSNHFCSHQPIYQLAFNHRSGPSASGCGPMGTVISPVGYLRRFRDTLATIHLTRRESKRKMQTTYHRVPGWPEPTTSCGVDPEYTKRAFSVRLEQYETAQPGTLTPATSQSRECSHLNLSFCLQRNRSGLQHWTARSYTECPADQHYPGFRIIDIEGSAVMQICSWASYPPGSTYSHDPR
jgi:hypothetical protein